MIFKSCLPKLLRDSGTGVDGLALVETAIVLPLLLLILFGLVDLSGAFSMHLRLRSASEEGLKLASKTVALANGTYSGLGPMQTCDAPSAPEEAVGHSAIQQRVMDALQLGGTIPTNLCIESAYLGESLTQIEEIVRIRINANYRGLLSPLFSIPVSAEISGPYLSGAPS